MDGVTSACIVVITFLVKDVNPLGTCFAEWDCPSNSYCALSFSFPPWDCECDFGYLEHSSSCLDPCDIVVCQPTEHCDEGACHCNTGHQRSQLGTCEFIAPTTTETTITDAPTSTTTEPLSTPPVVITIETTTDDLQSTSVGMSTSAFTQSTTTDAITTYASTSGVATTTGTSCNCVCVETNTTATLTISQIIEETAAKVKINTTTLSSHRRKLICATDDRQSSQTIGVLGAFLMALPFTCMLLSDIFSSLRYMCEQYSRSRKVDAIS